MSFSWTRLLIALSILLALALGVALLLLSLAPLQTSGPSSVVSSKHIVTAQAATGVDQRGAPTDASDTFTVGQKVYIAYTLSDAGPGTARIKLYDNGAFIDSQTQQFARRSTYNAFFTFPATQAGAWEADLYWQAPGASSDGALEQKVTFLVGNTPLADLFRTAGFQPAGEGMDVAPGASFAYDSSRKSIHLFSMAQNLQHFWG